MTGEVADDLAEMLAAQRTPIGCAVCRVVETMPPEHRAAIEEGFRHPRVNSTGIITWLKARGYELEVKAPNKVVLYHKERCLGL